MNEELSKLIEARRKKAEDEKNKDKPLVPLEIAIKATDSGGELVEASLFTGKSAQEKIEEQNFKKEEASEKVLAGDEDEDNTEAKESSVIENQIIGGRGNIQINEGEINTGDSFSRKNPTEADVADIKNKLTKARQKLNDAFERADKKRQRESRDKHSSTINIQIGKGAKFEGQNIIGSTGVVQINNSIIDRRRGPDSKDNK
ncbi:MAG TPA: hypothetical protein VJA17_00625 [Candidatus Omnitrophota bacterium]|nr:hypothetical protein [Candidatus Omnitrophota bacterium]